MKRIDFVVMLALFMGVLLVSVLSVWGWYQFVDGTLFLRPIQFETTVLQCTKDSYRPGELVQARLRYLKNRTAVEKVQWNLVSDVLIEYAPRTVALPTGQYDFLVDIAKIPENLPITDSQAKWRFVGVMQVPVNSMRELFYDIETSQFTIGSQ